VTTLAADESPSVTSRSASHGSRTAAMAVLAGVAYLFAAELGMTLTMRPQPISTLWPPNAILFGLLLLTPQGRWWVVLLGAFPAHLLVELWSGIPLPMILCWFLSNSSEALIGATLVRGMRGGPARFDTFLGVGIFLFAALTSVFVSCFLDAGFVQLNAWGSTGYWHNWRVRFLSNLLAQLTFVPVIATWGAGGLRDLRRLPRPRALEAGALVLLLGLVCLLVFTRPAPAANTSPALLYAPLPFLLWAAVRFGPPATSGSLLLVALLAVAGAVAGNGPFSADTPAANVVAMQSFLIVVAIPLMTLAAITRERAAAEERVRAGEKRLQLALDAAQMGTWEWEIGTGRGVWSDTSAAIVGSSSTGDDDLARFRQLVLPEDRAKVAAALEGASDGSSPYDVQFRIRHPDGSIRWIHAKAAALPDETGRLTRLVGVNADITDREMAYATVNEWKNRYEAAIRSSNQLLYDWDPNTDDVRYGGDLERILGYTEQEMGSGLAGWLEKVYADDRSAFEAEVARVIETHDSFRLVYRFRRKDGQVIWVEDRGHFFRDAQGVVSRMVGFIQDVSERTRSDQALRSSEERFSLVFRSSPQAIQITRQRDARILEVNDTWEAVFGYGREEAVGRTAADLGMFLSSADRERLLGLLDAGRPVRDHELELRTRSGEIRQVTIDAERVDVGGEPCYLTFVRDVTERRQAEAEAQEQRLQVAHLSRVAMLGEVSGALAHELNQPLTAILANARAAQRLMAQEPPDLGEVREILGEIADADRRAGEVIARLRAFLHKGEMQLGPVDLNDVVCEVLTLIHSDLIQRRVTVDTTGLSPDLPEVFADRVQMQQVLLNLLLNACDAILPDGLDRQVTIATAAGADGTVELSLADRGTGIPREEIQHIFEPFVTSKPDGLGLGLSICRSIVMAHEGRLWADNNVDGGATFHLRLPVLDASAEPG
jgi:PAS domain S-box-containing protein